MHFAYSTHRIIVSEPFFVKFLKFGVFVLKNLHMYLSYKQLMTKSKDGVNYGFIKINYYAHQNFY